MKIGPERIEEYKKIYIETYGKEISDTKAYEELHALVCLIDAVHRSQQKKAYS